MYGLPATVTPGSCGNLLVRHGLKDLIYIRISVLVVLTIALFSKPLAHKRLTTSMMDPHMLLELALAVVKTYSLSSSQKYLFGCAHANFQKVCNHLWLPRRYVRYTYLI